MEFGEILEEWERIKRERAQSQAQSRARSSGDESRGGGKEAASSSHAVDPPPDRRSTALDRRSTALDRRSTVIEALETWLDSEGVQDKDRGREEGERSGRESLRPAARDAARRAELRRLTALRPQARLDLHGMGAEAAQAALEAFLADSARAGLEKVLVVHGKGLHSEGKPVLKGIARRVVETSPWAGRFGPAERSDGGAGAIWVALRPERGREGL